MQELKTQNTELKAQNVELKTQSQVIMKMIEHSTRRNYVQFKSTLRYLHAVICIIILLPKVPQKISTPLIGNDFAIHNEGESSQPLPQ